MIREEKCPVCGTVNVRYSESETGIGLCEDQYFCKHCWYFDTMSYSAVLRGMMYPIRLRDKLQLTLVWIKYHKKIKEMGLRFYREDRCP